MEDMEEDGFIANEQVEQEQNVTIKEEKIKEPKPYRKGLRTAGIVFFVLAVIFAVVTVAFCSSLSGDTSELGTAIFSIFALVIFGLWTMYPAIIAGVLSVIFLSFSVKASKSSLAMLIISVIIVIVELALFIFCLVICFENQG